MPVTACEFESHPAHSCLKSAFIWHSFFVLNTYDELKKEYEGNGYGANQNDVVANGNPKF